MRIVSMTCHSSRTGRPVSACTRTESVLEVCEGRHCLGQHGSSQRVCGPTCTRLTRATARRVQTWLAMPAAGPAPCNRQLGAPCASAGASATLIAARPAVPRTSATSPSSPEHLTRSRDGQQPSRAAERMPLVDLRVGRDQTDNSSLVSSR